MDFEIGLRNQKKDFSQITEYIRKKLKTTFEKEGFIEEGFDDFASFEGTYINFKHPQRVSKLMVSISTHFEEYPSKDGKWVFYNLYTDIFYSSMNLNNPIEESTLDHPDATTNERIINKQFSAINKISLTPKDIDTKPAFDKFLDELPVVESMIYNDELSNVRGENFLKKIGGIGEKDSTFATREDLASWLEWLGLDIEQVVIDNEVDELLSQEAKDIFLF